MRFMRVFIKILDENFRLNMENLQALLKTAQTTPFLFSIFLPDSMTHPMGGKRNPA